MNTFRLAPGFEEAWRPPAGRRRTPEEVLKGLASGGGVRARLARIVRRAPEVMVKVTGRTRDAGHLKAHLAYISRHGDLPLETSDGWALAGREEVRDLAADWSAMALADSRRRANTPFSLSIVLSMPQSSDPAAVRDAAGGFTREVFGDRFDYVFALHTDTPRPHVHVAVRGLGYSGERLNPKKADLDAWRQVFARELRDRGVEAEATPRRARGVTRKAERSAIRRIRERAAAGAGAPGRVQREALHAAARTAFGVDREPKAWETQLLARQARVRSLYLAQARMMQASVAPDDQALGRAVEAFVRAMPAPDTQRLALARALREANARQRDVRDVDGSPRPAAPGRSRER